MSRSGGFETTEFRRSFGMETDQLLRTRLKWFVIIWGGIGIVSVIGLLALALFSDASDFIVTLMQGQAGGWRQILGPLGLTLWIVAYGFALFAVLVKRQLTTKSIIGLSILLICCDGLFSLLAREGGVPFYNLSYFWFAHLVACAVFPWTVRQALIPIAVILPLSVLGRLTIGENSTVATVTIGTIWMLVTLAPGVFICGMRHTQRVQRATNRFLHQRYGMLRQELAYARQVHEALFPDPKPTGSLRFSYQYEPMRQIGGDYLYAHTTKIDGTEELSVVLLDVTGHGIPAALTVNRLHGEIDLRFAEQPDIGPGELLGLLNRYVHLTLAKHSIFATAVCFRFNAETGRIRYASGGHPPAFIRGIDGSLRELDPTSFVLGACKDDDFDPGELEVEFHPGDSLIAYTDGAIEARSLEGKMIQINGLRQMLSAPVMPGVSGGGLGTWSQRILSEVTKHRGGMPPEDDTLAIEVFRPIASRANMPADGAAASGDEPTPAPAEAPAT